MELDELTIIKAHEGLKKKDFSAKELCQAYLERIEKENPELNAYLHINEKALEQAEAVDEKIKGKKEFSLLAGIPCAIKDNILVQGLPCTAASRILENYTAPYDATVIKKLKDEDAVILGKVNLDEFAMGASNEYSAFGPVKNPHDKNRVAGGSSGGAAAAVAADLAIFALGSETNGSIRLPAAFCGVVGLKPTYGSVSRYGLIAMTSSLDQIGPLAKTASDCRIVFEAIRGRDDKDSTSIAPQSFGRSKLELFESFKRLTIGLPREYFQSSIDKEAQKLMKAVIEKFAKAGAKIKEITLPHTQYALAAYYIGMPSEVSTNLARYDGIKYGKTAAIEEKTNHDLWDVYCQSRQKYFGNEAKRRIMLGTFALSAGYYDAYYLQAQKMRTKIKEDFIRAFRIVDVIVAPASPSVAFKLGDKTKDPVQMYLADVFMAGSSLAGLTGIVLPCGYIDNLPFSFQIIGNAFEEMKILHLAELFESIK